MKSAAQFRPGPPPALMSAAERDLVRALTVGIGRYYGVDAPVLGSR